MRFKPYISRVESQILKGKVKGNYSIVPNLVFSDVLISERARLVCAWWAGRPPTWTFTMSGTAAALGFTEYKWREVSRELLEAGILVSRRIGGKGVITWVHIVDLRRFYPPADVVAAPSNSLRLQPV